MDRNQQPLDGRTNLQQTIELVTAILMCGTDSKRVYEPQKLDVRQTLNNNDWRSCTAKRKGDCARNSGCRIANAHRCETGKQSAFSSLHDDRGLNAVR